MGKKENSVRMIYDRNIKLKKYWCVKCRAYSFANGDRLVCCDSNKPKVKQVIDEHAVAKNMRKRVLKDRSIFERDNYHCVYCGKDLSHIEFYTTRRSQKIHKLIPTIDHLVPYSFALADDRNNLVTSCNLCNNIKGSHVFTDIADAQAYIWHRLQKLGVEYSS